MLRFRAMKQVIDITAIAYTIMYRKAILKLISVEIHLYTTPKHFKDLLMWKAVSSVISRLKIDLKGPIWEFSEGVTPLNYVKM